MAYSRAARGKHADAQLSERAGTSDYRRESIKRRVIRLVLIPSAAALAISLAASAYLVFNGFYNRAVANSVRQVSIPAVPALASVQQERALSIIYLTQRSRGLDGLLEQRQQTEERLGALRVAAENALSLAPESITSRWAKLTGYLDRLPTVRSTVDSRTGSPADVAAFYDELLAAATDLFDTQARVVPDATAAQGGLTATDVFRVSEAMSRAGSLINGALGSRTLSQADYLEFVQLVGAYHNLLQTIEPHLEPGARARYVALVESDPWQRLGRVEQSLIAAGSWRDGVPRNVSLDRGEWESLTHEVSLALADLTVQQADEVSAQALSTGNEQLFIASLASAIALLLVLLAAAWAVRQSRILVDRSLSIRLERLAKDAAEVVNQQLPTIMTRLSRGEQVDLSVEMPVPQYGADEIGRVGEVIQQALQVAVKAAADQATLRQAAQVMLRGVAHRPQMPLQAALMVVTEMQRQVGDAKMLGQLFDAHHKLAQTRRFLENLLILSGGQVGRKFRTAVPIRSVIKAAQSESRDYERVAVRTVPDVALAPQAITDVLHLLAELIDNALQFSPPGSEVTVTCNVVENGVAIEVEDRGLGMEPDELRRRNDLLVTGATPDITALRDGSTIGLHVVAELARRENVQVTLRSSAYGGTLAIVLVPKALILAPGAAPVDTDAARQPAMAGVSASPPQFRDGAVASPPQIRATPARAAGYAQPAGRYPAVASAPPMREEAAPEPRDGVLRTPQVSMFPVGTSAAMVAKDEPPSARAGRPVLEGRVVPEAPALEESGPEAQTRPRLPKRSPQAHLADGLRTEGPSAAEEGLATADQAAAVETSLARFARFRNNLHAGTSAPEVPGPSADQGTP
ncbi:sensor histidine kinase [Asanoa iriomotensis]|uniref:histidine kinase n=1 Tax=Asanoa iriomotensis TaxID=234613 RepID=A0ABQ4CAH2_9ACTN|nr:sensor histidine kinase [Asanoa iriomotensis]GIF59780.1 histidine kinase [Asanoa iriomotensis]